MTTESCGICNRTYEHSAAAKANPEQNTARRRSTKAATHMAAMKLDGARLLNACNECAMDLVAMARAKRAKYGR